MNKKPIIAVDFNGALLKSRPFDEAHKNWFYLMSVLLKDNSIREYAGLENYFEKVNEVMKRYLGEVEEETRITFARNLFSMTTIAEVRKDDLIKDFADYLENIKKKYRLALITSAPENSVEPILKKLGCSNLFDILYKSPIGKHPDKMRLFEEFIREYEKPVYYIGAGDKDILGCKKLGIITISVNWISKGKTKGDYNISRVKELEKIIE